MNEIWYLRWKKVIFPVFLVMGGLYYWSGQKEGQFYKGRRDVPVAERRRLYAAYETKMRTFKTSPSNARKAVYPPQTHSAKPRAGRLGRLYYVVLDNGAILRLAADPHLPVQSAERMAQDLRQLTFAPEVERHLKACAPAVLVGSDENGPIQVVTPLRSLVIYRHPRLQLAPSDSKERNADRVAELVDVLWPKRPCPGEEKPGATSSVSAAVRRVYFLSGLEGKNL
ncbi:MAG: hypothetical protein AB7G93_06865 [Bdellovibrionales bacterium]